MELAALAILGAAGFVLAKQTAPAPVYPTRNPGANPVARPGIGVKEAFANQTQRNVSNLASSLRGPNPQLDIMYNDLMGRGALNSQPNSLGGKLTYLPGNVVSSTQPANSTVSPLSLDEMASPADGITSATPDVMMNPAGIEETPSYVAGDDFVSALSGRKMKSADFVHNNMQPYFGSRVRQNVNPGANSGYLDAYTGSGTTQIRKKEVEQMFDNTQTAFGNVYGMESSSDFVQSRINDPRNRAGERPFEPVQVAPGVGEGFSSTGKGGFQQIEVNDIMIKNIRRTDDLRVASNPKLTYNTPVVPGQQFIGKSAENAGEVRKYRPDGFYIDENGERFGAAGQGAFQKETNRPVQIMPDTARQETSVEYHGAGASQDFGMNYVVGSYRKPMASQFGGAGYRNADASMYNMKAENDDFGKESYEVRPNERYFTSERGQGLNLSPAEAGAVTTHFEDESRPTRRGETIGNIQQAGVATGYAGGAPAITVWDPNDIARTTVKEGTIFLDRFGIAAPADGPTRLKAYDPADIARPTQKAQISAKSAYTGGPKAAHERHMNHTFAYNMRLNPNKQQISKGRKLAGGNIQVFKGDEPNVTSKKLDVDIINDRAPAVNRSLDLGPGSADIGSVKYRAPPKSTFRIEREIIEATDSNPLMQSLRRNAEHDAKLFS
jgi:hypothetical protein